MTCVFCEIIEGRGKRELISETKNTISILSNPSQSKAHCLVMPKKHVEKLSELSETERNELINEVIKIEELLLKNFEGCDIKQNYRPFVKDNLFKISHLHFHLQPRDLDDEVFQREKIFSKDKFKNLSDEDLKKIKEFILK